MGKQQTTLTLDEDVLAALKARSDRTGLSVDEWVERILRQELGFDLLDRLQRRNNLSEAEAMALTLDAQRAVRQTGGMAWKRPTKRHRRRSGTPRENTDDSLRD